MQKTKSFIKKFNLEVKNMFREFANKSTRKKQCANMLTFSRIILAFLIPILTFVGMTISSNFALIIIASTTALGAITDFADGYVARKYNITSEFGSFLDTISDKIFSVMIGISLAFINPLFLINILGEACIAFYNVNYYLKHDASNQKSTLIGKIKQWPLGATFILGFLSTLVPSLTTILNAIIFSTLSMQILTLGSYIYKNKANITESKSRDANPIIKSNNLEVDNIQTDSYKYTYSDGENNFINYDLDDLDTKSYKKVRKL